MCSCSYFLLLTHLSLKHSQRAFVTFGSMFPFFVFFSLFFCKHLLQWKPPNTVYQGEVIKSLFCSRNCLQCACILGSSTAHRLNDKSLIYFGTQSLLKPIILEDELPMILSFYEVKQKYDYKRIMLVSKRSISPSYFKCSNFSKLREKKNG